MHDFFMDILYNSKKETLKVKKAQLMPYEVQE